MLFFLDANLINEDISSTEGIIINRAIENILRSVWESKHLVQGDITTIIELKNKIVNKDCLNVLTFIDSNYSFLNYSSIKFHINVVRGVNIMELNHSGDKSILNVSVDFFQTTDLLQETKILCEDISDSSFFEEICNHYIRTNSIGSISLKYSKEHGGGTQIDVMYTNIAARKNRFCLTFCDNDKRHPNSDIGGTLRKLRLVNTSNNLFCKYIELDAHEIENLVPFNYLDDINEATLNNSGIEFIKRLFVSNDNGALQYLDIKKGINKKQVDESLDFFVFMENLLPYCQPNITIADIGTYSQNDRIIPHTGKIIKSLMSNVGLFTSKFPDLLTFQENEWNKIGSNFLYWTCARNNEALNL